MKDKTIQVTTTQGIDGRPAVAYLGLVSGQAVYGANFMKDFFAGIRDVIGGRSGSYEKVLRGGREAALADMLAEAQALGADAVIGVDVDYETIKESMLMVTMTGTAVKLD